MLKNLVVNASAHHYNLGARKLADWLRDQGESVDYHSGDPGLFGSHPNKVWLSVIFSWDTPIALEIAKRYKEHADIEFGGPGVFTPKIRKHIKDNVGIDAHIGLDERFEKQRGNYKMVFASRGCPVGCSFCIVPKLEGLDQTVDYDFQPAPILCDNNLSALPVDFQEYIIRRYKETGTLLKDANSGFEPITFDEGTYHRWKEILRGPWRFAFDTTSEEPQVKRMMKILEAVKSPKKKQVYVLIGNEPIAACYERAEKVIDWGGEPYVQPLMLLSALTRDDLKIAYDWDFQKLRDFQRFYNRHLWRKIDLWEYRPRKMEKPPFVKSHLTQRARGRAEESRQNDVIQQPEQIPLFQADSNPAARR